MRDTHDPVPLQVPSVTFGGPPGIDQMEALWTHNDNLQWEVHRLDAENQILTSENNPEASDCLDLETELEQTKSDIVVLTERVQAYQRQLEELRERAGAETVIDSRSAELELVQEEFERDGGDRVAESGGTGADSDDS